MTTAERGAEGDVGRLRSSAPVVPAVAALLPAALGRPVVAVALLGLAWLGLWHQRGPAVPTRIVVLASILTLGLVAAAATVLDGGGGPT